MSEVDPAEAVQRVRQISGVSAESGPSDADIVRAIEGFISAFDHWYIRVLRNVFPQYRAVIISRINFLIRRMELKDVSAVEAAERIIKDYVNRNFVTAGGWAIEQLATNINRNYRKSGINGIDIESTHPITGEHSLYVLKSGPVTRNSDIVNALKTNAKRAERTLRQGRNAKGVRLIYAIASGKTTNTFEDGVYRPSSAKLWSELTELEEDKAISLVSAIALEAGRYVQRDADQILFALNVLVSQYISDDEGNVDWAFLTLRNSNSKALWNTEDLKRHKRAMAAVEQVLPPDLLTEQE